MGIHGGNLNSSHHCTCLFYSPRKPIDSCRLVKPFQYLKCFTVGLRLLANSVQSTLPYVIKQTLVFDFMLSQVV